MPQRSCAYAEQSDGSFDVLSLSLASQPVQSIERPDRDVSVPYQVDSVFKEGAYRGGFIRIPVDLGGCREWLILDNGAAKFSGVTASFAAAHGIRPTGATGKGRGSTGEASSYWIGIADSLSVGDLLVRNLLFAVFPDGSMETPYLRLDAILGSNFFRLAGEMRIDNRNRSVTFPWKYEDRTSNLTLNGGDQHFVDVAVLGDTLRMQLDLGCISTDLNHNYYKRNKKAVRSIYEAKTSMVFGVGGSRQVITYRVKELPLEACNGRFVKEDADIFTVQMRDDPGVYGMLGSDFILHFDTVTLNLDRMYLYVTPAQGPPN